MASYDTVPKTAKIQPTKFKVAVPDQKLQQMKQLVSLSPIGPETYENLHGSRELEGYGLPRQWLADAKAEWENKFDWRASEAHINSFPNYTLPVTDDDGKTYTIHFVALFSSNPSATPLAFFHGWPGSFLEFLPILSLLKKKYPSPDKLPYHVIVPSLPGYAFSDRPPKERDWTGQDSARLMHKLLVDGLGLTGYVVQGGDIGSFISRYMASQYDECKAMHLNFCPVIKPDSVPDSALSPAEQAGLARGGEFRNGGMAYAIKHGTRPATIGLVLSASPIALLAWIGEKFWTWSDTPPSTATVLESISLYWLTETFPTSIYTYRQGLGPKATNKFGTAHADPQYHVKKPFGYSWFPQELMPAPVEWARTSGNMVWSRAHDRGGHFAALEKPELLLGDVEEFLAQVEQKK